MRGEIRGGGGGIVPLACLSQLNIGHASLSRRSTVPTPMNSRDTSNIRALLTCILFYFILRTGRDAKKEKGGRIATVFLLLVYLVAAELR